MVGPLQALGILLVDLVGREREDGRQLANHGLEHVREHRLGTAASDAVGSV